MIKQVVLCLQLLLTSYVAFAESNKDGQVLSSNNQVSILLVGSAEYPDPVLKKVLALEKQGLVTDVVIMESFPVRIRLKGPEKILKELELIPRKPENN